MGLSLLIVWSVAYGYWFGMDDWLLVVLLHILMFIETGLFVYCLLGCFNYCLEMLWFCYMVSGGFWFGMFGCLCGVVRLHWCWSALVGVWLLWICIWFGV